MTENKIYWFRYEDRAYSQGPYINLVKLEFIRETEHCVFLSYYGVEKRVLKIARKRFAYPTVELAQQSFKARKSWQLRHLNVQRDHVQAVISLISNGKAFEQQSKQFRNELEDMFQ